MASSYFMLKMIKRKRLARKRLEIEMMQQEKIRSTNAAGSTLDLRCRICLKEGYVPIYDDENALGKSEDIRTFGGIEIHRDDEFPKYLCGACDSILQNAVMFRKRAKETDLLLHQNVRNRELSIEIEFNDVRNDFSDIDDSSCKVETTKSFSCKLCKLNFKTSDEYLTHKNSKQHKNVRIQCTICHRLLTAQLYKRHLVRHQSASHLVCEVCGKMYRKDNLVRHLQLHNFELPFQCQLCPYRGRFMDSLKIHMRTHTGDKPFSCDECELRFLTRSNLNRHLLTHKKDRPFKCIECGRGFYTKKELDLHFKSDHAGIKDFCCKMCGNKYGTRKALMRHELRVHKRDKMAKGRMPLYLQVEYRMPNE